jgi:hypothetical protein
MAVIFLLRDENSIKHFFNRRHPSPFLLASFWGKIKVNIRSLYPEYMRFVILHFVVRFNSQGFFERNDFGWVFVDSLLFKAVEVGAGEHNESLLPLFEKSRLLDDHALFDFILLDVFFYLASGFFT